MKRKRKPLAPQTHPERNDRASLGVKVRKNLKTKGIRDEESGIGSKRGEPRGGTPPIACMNLKRKGLQNEQFVSA